MSFLDGLNDSQKRAVNHHNGPLLVIAGAGSGKTRALTHRIAHLLGIHDVDPSQVIAVTFTNKAAREMKERLEILLVKKLAARQFGQPFSTLPSIKQRELRTQIYQEITKDLWIGTFHSLFARLLRYDIDKFVDQEGLTWTKQFSIYDEADAQSLIKEIVTQELQLDPKRFEPKKARWSISHAKNNGWTPAQLQENVEGKRGELTAEIYRRYKRALSANNALDFDDLLLIPVQLLKQNAQVCSYWNKRFRHLLVDEFQDTNRTQYELIKLLVTNGEDPQSFNYWENRSIFVVGDADQSIYSFRAADFTILMGFQNDFSNNSQANQDSSIVKLEENYRSTSTILEAANTLIENNTERIEKVLRATRSKGDKITLTKCDDEISEAESIVYRMRILKGHNPESKWKDISVLYRTNAQSRSIEESLVRWRIPYTVVGGLRFYDRREIKDILAYLKVLTNNSDSVSLLRIINVPRRGIGKTTIQRITDASNQLRIPLWEIVSDSEAVRSLGGRSAKGLLQFCELISELKQSIEKLLPSEAIQLVLEKSGYLQELITNANDESEERRRNLQELVNASLQYQEENESSDLEGFLASAALASDADNKDTSADRVTLMTLHSSKGLEFPIVFLVGMEQGLFPSFRSLDNPASLEEERRLCYVGITRAKEKLYLSHASERRTWGGMREPTVPSIFLSELPEDLLEGDLPRTGGASINRNRHLERLTRVDRDDFKSNNQEQTNNLPKNAVRKLTANPIPGKEWVVGDSVEHSTFGEGKITHIFGSGEKISIAVKFGGMSPKILDPRLAPIKPINGE